MKRHPLFGALKVGAVPVMVNPFLKPDAIAYFYEYTAATAALVHAETLAPFRRGAFRLAYEVHDDFRVAGALHDPRR